MVSPLCSIRSTAGKHGSKMANYSNLWSNVPRREFSNRVWFSWWGKTTNKKSSLYMPQLLWRRKTVFKYLMIFKSHTVLLVFIIVMLFIEMVLEKECIFAMCRVVIKCMAKHLIYVLISGGIRANDLLFAIGNTVVNGLLDLMNSR